MWKDVLDFQIKFYSQNGTDSPVIDFLVNLLHENKELAFKSANAIKRLPQKIYANFDIKPIKKDGEKFYELKVQSGNDITRFFFIIEKPNVIVLFGFVKKSQKISQKHLNQGLKNFQDYQKNKISISIDFDILL